MRRTGVKAADKMADQSPFAVPAELQVSPLSFKHAPGAFHSAPCFYSLSLTSSFCPTHYYRRSFLIPLPHSFFLFLLAPFVQDHEASPPQSPIIDQCISPPVLASSSLFSYPLITVSGPNFFLFPVSLNFPLFFPSFPYPLP